MELLGQLKMALRVPESKFQDCFYTPKPPQKNQQDTLGNPIGPRKVILDHFIDFGHFPIDIPIEVEKSTQMV